MVFWYSPNPQECATTDHQFVSFDVYQGSTLLAREDGATCDPSISSKVVPDASLPDTLRVVVGPKIDWAVCVYQWGPAALGMQPGPFPATPPDCNSMWVKDYQPQ
jgi:hypothetical protein